jgi:hypothetical protein
MTLPGTLRIRRAALVSLLVMSLALVLSAPVGAHTRATGTQHKLRKGIVTKKVGAHRGRSTRRFSAKRKKPTSSSTSTGNRSGSPVGTSSGGGSSGVGNGTPVSTRPTQTGGSSETPPTTTPPTTTPLPTPPPVVTTPPPTTTETPSTPNSAGSLLFNGGFSSGLAAWYLQAISSRVAVVAGPEGGTAARFEVRQGDVEPQTGAQRAEVVAPLLFEEGQDLYIHDKIRVPAENTFNAPWQIIQQLHEDSSENSPGVAVFLENNHALRISSGNSAIQYWKGPALQTGRWYDLTYRVLLSRNSSVGTVEVWLDGVQQQMVNGSPTAHGPTATAARTFFKAGIYRSSSSTGTSVVEHDDLAIGSTRAAAEG